MAIIEFGVLAPRFHSSRASRGVNPRWASGETAPLGKRPRSASCSMGTRCPSKRYYHGRPGPTVHRPFIGREGCWPPARCGMRILLVEDEPDAARMIAKGLRERAYAVDVVGDGE